MDRLKRGQAAFEFISYFSLFLLVFVIALAYMSNEEIKEIRMREDFLAKEVAYQLASEVDFAVQAGDGYSRFTQIPVRAGTIDYKAYVKNGFIELNWTRGNNAFFAIAPLSTSDVSSTTLLLTPTPDNAYFINASKGFLRINNTGGRIYVDQ